MRKVIKKVLSDLGFLNTAEAHDGKNAFDILVELSKTDSPIEFIICDWNMPNLTGIELLKKCKAEKSFKNLPFVLITAENEQEKIVEAAKMGVTDFIIKPFSPALLQAKFVTYYNKIEKQKATRVS